MTRIHSKTTAESGKTAVATTPAVHPSFEFIRAVPIDSLRLTVEEYRHRKTGARYFHLASSNPENVFLVALRTVPMDSTGVAHILEHTALCGSEHYPVRDPFFMMIRRSLNTFMNAFTSSDWTAYPFSSQNSKDFNNLMDVYLDAVFFSRLHELDFAQEGHRLEFETPDDPNTDLVYKGVVFNEMKGSMSSPVNTLWHTLSHHLYPTTTYHYNSGGEPADIPTLSYEELKAFYATHYHPSNAVFMTYGNIPAVEHQARFEEKALARFDRLDSHIEVGDERRYTQPVVVEDRYALDEPQGQEDKTHIVVGWLLGKSADARKLMEAHLLSSVLLDNGASPLRHALETTDLGAAPSPLSGLEDSNREMAFVCGLEGSRVENAQAVEELVLDVLGQVAEQGVPQDRVEAVLHQLELGQREIRGDHYPYGLQLILEGLSPVVHGGDPVALLNLDPVLEDLRQAIQDPEFIKGLARELLLENPHRVRLTLRPDSGLAAERDRAERDRLAAIKDNLDAKEKQHIVEQAAALAARQEQEDDPEVLPKVTLDDVPKDFPIPEGERSEIGGAPATFYTQGTNGLVYEQVVIDLPQLDDDLVPLLPHFTHCLTELGSGGRDYMETQAHMDAVTGGVHASASVRGAIDDVQRTRSTFVLSGKALARNHEGLSEFMHETLETVRWDELDRMREILAQDRAHAEQSVTGNGHGLAMGAAASRMSPAAALNHRWRGLAGIQALKSLDDRLSDRGALEKLAGDFQRIHEILLRAGRQFLIVGEEERRSDFAAGLGAHWRAASGGLQAFSPAPIRETVREMWVTSTQVNFCAKAYPTVPIEHEDAAPLAVLGGFLRNGFLHRVIREQGGAYGGGAGHDPDNAVFRFFSYRDPRLAETLADFDRSLDWLQSNGHDGRQLEEAILGVIGSIDKPGSPAGEAKKAFHSSLHGRTSDQRRRFRSRILGVSLDDLRRVGAQYLRPEVASVAVVTSGAASDQATDLGLETLKL
ncbi:MAG: insulinase family protein [Acidiferrobacteraceae bacterium]|jgi:Zn-dependent M16 (insulinase) family peptidase